MPNNYQIKQTVQFPEQTAVLKEQSENALFDILVENVKDNDTYCQELINKILKLPYAKLPEFFSHAIALIQNKLNLVNFGSTLFDCIRIDSAKGHTPGHPLLTIFSDQQELKHVVDIVHSSLLLSHPEWGTQWDVDFTSALETRRSLLDQCSSNRQTVISCHLPWPGIGHIVHNNEGGFGWRPMAFSTPQLYETFTK